MKSGHLDLDTSTRHQREYPYCSIQAFMTERGSVTMIFLQNFGVDIPSIRVRMFVIVYE